MNEGALVVIMHSLLCHFCPSSTFFVLPPLHRFSTISHNKRGEKVPAWTDRYSSIRSRQASICPSISILSIVHLINESVVHTREQ